MSTKKLGEKLIRYMKSKNWRIRPLNIVYLEDANADTWQPVLGQIDVWDDVRIVVSDKGEVLLSCEATCEPGAWYTYHRMNSKGAFRIASDRQFLDAWTFGDHKGQLALVQCGEIQGFRDDNEDGIRPGDVLDEGIFGVNQHTTGINQFAPAPEMVGRYSAGCLVGRHPNTHFNKFIPLLRESGMCRFDTAIIPADRFTEFS